MDSLVSGVRALPQPERVTSVGSVAEALHHIAGAMSDTQVMTVGEGIVGWIGRSAGAFAHEARHIQAAVRKVQGAIANVIAALNEYQSVCNGLTQQIRSHQQNWDSNIAWYKKEVSEIQSQVGAASGGRFPLLDAVDGVEVAEAALRARLDERQADEARAYNKTVEAVDAAAASTAGKLRAAVDGVVPGVTGPDGARGVPSRAAVGLALFGGTKGILAAQSRWAAAEADAPAAAELINRIDGKTKLPSQAALRQFNATYGARLASDPYFATMLMREIGAEQLYVTGAKMTSHGLMSESYRNQLKKYVSDMGAGLILATGGSSKTDTDTTNGFKALDNTLTTDGKKTIRQWRSDFQAALNKYGQTSYDYEFIRTKGADLTYSPTRKLYGYELLGQYLGYGARAHPELSVGDHFLNGVDGKNSMAKAMVKWDAQHHKNFDLNDTIVTSNTGKSAGKEAGMLADGQSWDYLQNMYEAMDNAPDKTPARTFMNSTLEWKNGTENKQTNMTRYLIGHRNAGEKEGIYTTYWADDKGESLGKLVHELSNEPNKKESAQIAFNFIKGYTDGLNRNYDNGDFGNSDKIDGQDVYGYHNANLRSWAGQIIAPYTNDIAHSLADPDPVIDRIDYRGDKKYHLVFGENLKNNIMGNKGMFCDLMFDNGINKRPAAINVISGTSMAEMDREFKEGVRSGNNVMLNKSVKAYSYLFTSIYEAPEAKDNAIKTYRAEKYKTLSKVIDWGIGKIAWEGIFAKEGTSNTIENIKKHGLELKNLYTPSESAPTFKGFKAQNKVELLIAQKLNAAKYNNEDYSKDLSNISEQKAKEEYVKYNSSDDENFLDKNGRNVSNPTKIQSSEYFQQKKNDMAGNKARSYAEIMDAIHTYTNDAEKESREADEQS